MTRNDRLQQVQEILTDILLECPQPASPHFDQRCDEAEFELIVAGEFFAGASGPRAEAWAAIQGIARDCGPDECEFYEVTRRRVYA